jgi:hypothetical protein
MLRRCRIVLLLLPLGVAACGPSEPLRVDTIQLGRSLNPDNSVANHTTLFKPTETVYVSALTQEPGYGTFVARWTYNGRVIDEPKKEVTYRGPAATEFHLQATGGFPPGDYSVEILLNGESVGKRTFRVDK